SIHFFFFSSRRRHTRSYGDWSSDVCSSDLAARGGDDKFVALLLEYKALVDLPSKEGITPLMAAAGVDYGSRVTRGRNRTDEGVRSEERRVGEECRARGWVGQEIK